MTMVFMILLMIIMMIMSDNTSLDDYDLDPDYIPDSDDSSNEDY